MMTVSYDAAKKRYDEATKKYEDCLKALPRGVGDAPRSTTTSPARYTAAVVRRPPCFALAYATASRDAALIAGSPKLTPLVRKIIRERPIGSAGARQAKLDLNRVRQILQREQTLAKAIIAALKPCTSG